MRQHDMRDQAAVVACTAQPAMHRRTFIHIEDTAMATSCGAGESGMGRQDSHPRPGGSAAGVARHDSPAGTRQAIEGDENDDLSAATEEGTVREGSRATPPMGDLRSDAGAGAGSQNGEPL